MVDKESVQFFLVGAIVVVVCMSFVVFTADDIQRILLTGPKGEGEGVNRPACASDLVLVSASGERDLAVQGAPLDLLVVAAQSGPRAPLVDLSKATVVIASDGSERMLERGGPGPSFALGAVHDADGSLRWDPPVLTGGDFMEIRVDLAAVGMQLFERDRVQFVLDCGDAGRLGSGLEAPAGFGGSNVVRLERVRGE